ncbi:hypothetical protein Tco_0031846 [Tanacetum coccineum]
MKSNTSLKKIYREDGSEEVISNLKTRLDQLTQTEQELKIDLNKPLKEQDPLNELNELANKKRKRTSDLKDHSRGRLLGSVPEPFTSALQVLRRLGIIFTSVYAAVQKLKKDFEMEKEDPAIVTKSLANDFDDFIAKLGSDQTHSSCPFDVECLDFKHRLKRDKIRKAPIWVKLHHVPIVAYSKCLKLPKVDAPAKTTDDGFMEVKKKKSKAKSSKSRQIEGLMLTKPALNLQYCKVKKEESSNASEKGGDFNSALFLEDSMAGLSCIDISMREFKDCVAEIKVLMLFSNRIMHRITRHWSLIFPLWLSRRLILLSSIMFVNLHDRLKSLFREGWETGNLHVNVIRLRDELDRIETDLDADPFNVDLRESEANYVGALNEALIMEEHFLKPKAKIDWLFEKGIPTQPDFFKEGN